MKRLFGVLVPVLLVMFCLAPAAVTLADDQPALPDYTKEPFREIGTHTGILPDHEDWGELTVTGYATAATAVPGEQGVFVFVDKDGNKKLADWVVVNADETTTIRRYLYQDGWKFEKFVE